MLTLALEQFTWQRPAGRKKGFAWEGKGDVMRLVRIPDVPLEDYQPHGGLYRDFAGLLITPEAVLRFANQYGYLKLVGRPAVDEISEDEISYGRFNEDWVKPIREMKEMVALADAVASGDLAAIRAALGPRSILDREAMGCEQFDRELNQGKTPDPKHLPPNEVVTVAARRLYYPLPDCVDWYPEATWNAKTKSVHVRLKYWGLREFMYGQLCLSLIEGRQFQQCTACGKWFQLAPSVNRADRTTCSSSCRFIAYRRRRRRAVELHGKGWSIKKIAKEIGSDISKVKQWVSKPKG
jgi:hypothetical protein